MLGLGLGDGRLAEQVDGEGQRLAAHGGDGLERLGDVGAGDEAAGHALGVDVGGPGRATSPPTPFSGSQRTARRIHARQVVAGLGEYSRRCRLISSAIVRFGRASMKRNSCTLTAASPIDHCMSRSSSQAG